MIVVECPRQDLYDFTNQAQDARELKRTLAVKLTLKGILQSEIMVLLQVTSGKFSKLKGIYQRQGASGLKLSYQGGVGYLALLKTDVN